MCEDTDGSMLVSDVLEDADLLASFISDILLQAYIKHGPDYLNAVLDDAEQQVFEHTQPH